MAVELLLVARASAQVVSPVADNDMDPSFSDDGWVESEGTFKVVKRFTSPPSPRPGGGQLAYREPPDGNAYAAAATQGGNVLSKEIVGLTPGTAYVVEWYLSGDRADWQVSYLASDYFAVTFCGTTQESERVAFNEEGAWRAQSLVFVADAPSCTLSFRSLGEPGGGHPSGIGGNYNNYAMLDGVQVSPTTLTDFGLSVVGPAMADEAPTTVSFTVDNAGPDEGAIPIVTYRGGGSPVAPGPVAVSGPDAASWSCATVPPYDRWIACTRAAPLPIGSSESFAFDVVFAVSPNLLTSRVGVAATLYAGNADPSLANNTATFVTLPPAPVCGNGRVDPGENCDDGNVVAGDGCGATCISEPGYDCFAGRPCVDVDECATDTASCFADLQCTNTAGGWTCGCEPGAPDCNSPPSCRQMALNGHSPCPIGYDCRNTANAYVCVCDPHLVADCPTVVCGDGQLTGYETCDDGNTVDGDGCDHNCRGDLDWVCFGTPSTCVYRPRGCTNRIVDFNETCDDGGLANDDGCDQTCQIEPGWTCSGAPSVCQRISDGGSGGVSGAGAGGTGEGGSGGAGEGGSGGDSGPPACPPQLTLNPRTQRCVPKLLRGCSAASSSDAAGSLWLLALALCFLRASRRRY